MVSRWRNCEETLWKVLKHVVSGIGGRARAGELVPIDGYCRTQPQPCEKKNQKKKEIAQNDNRQEREQRQDDRKGCVSVGWKPLVDTQRVRTWPIRDGDTSACFRASRGASGPPAAAKFSSTTITRIKFTTRSYHVRRSTAPVRRRRSERRSARIGHSIDTRTGNSGYVRPCLPACAPSDLTIPLHHTLSPPPPPLPFCRTSIPRLLTARPTCTSPVPLFCWFFFDTQISHLQDLQKFWLGWFFDLGLYWVDINKMRLKCGILFF